MLSESFKVRAMRDMLDRNMTRASNAITDWSQVDGPMSVTDRHEFIDGSVVTFSVTVTEPVYGRAPFVPAVLDEYQSDPHR